MIPVAKKTGVCLGYGTTFNGFECNWEWNKRISTFYSTFGAENMFLRKILSSLLGVEMIICKMCP